MSRVLETILTGRNLLSPVLAQAGRDVVTFNSTVAGANEKAAASGAASARAQQAAASSSAAASGKASTAAAVGATTQSAAADKIAASNVKASTSATASAQAQARAHSQAAQSATVASRTQQAANQALIRSNGLLGTSLTPLTAGLGALGLGLAYAGYRGMDFDAAMSQVQAASQATAADMDRFRDAAVKAGADTQYSAVEAAGGITEMSKAGVEARDILGGGLKGALNLAAAGQMEVADAAEIGATALNVFNLEGNQMAHVADLLAAGAGKAQGSVYDLGQALNQSALVASATGLSIEETAGSLALFASQGLIGSDAGTSFRQMLLHLQNPSKESAALMADLGISMYDANGQFVGMQDLAGQLQTRMAGLTQQQRDQAMATIFGADAVRASNILYEAGAKGIEEWTAKVNDAGYAQKQATQLTDNLRGDLERLGGAFDSVMTTIGSGAQGPLREVVQALTAIVNAGGDVIGFWNSLPGPVQAAVVALGAFALLKGPVSSAVETIALRAMYAGDAIRAATGATTGWTTALGAARVGIVSLVAAAAPLAAAIGIAYAVRDVVTFGSETDDARESVEALGKSVESLPVGEQIRAYRDEIQALQEQIAGVEDQGLFNKYVWNNPFQNEDKDVAQFREQIELLQGRIESLEDTTPGSMEVVAGAVRTAAAATVQHSQEAQEALKDWLENLQSIGEAFVDPLAIYQGLLDEKITKEREAAEATAASTESSSDSWKDYVGDVEVSLAEYATALETQNTAHLNWRDNLVAVTQRGGLEVGQILAGMGVEGAQITAQMATATAEDFERMKAALIEEARLGGQGAAAELDMAMKLMAIVTREGGKVTVGTLMNELGLGLQQVADLAGRYGITLAGGINPLLTALGKNRISGVNGRVGGLTEADGAVVDFFANGGVREDHRAQIAPAGAWRVWAEPETGGEGYVPLSPAKRDTSLPIWREIGRRLDAPEAQFFANGGFASAADVPRPYSTAPYGPPISTAADAVMQKGFDEVRAWLQANAEATQGGTAGGGAVGGAWGSLWQLVKSQIPQARINSAFRAGDPGYHGRGKAIDIGFGTGPGGAGSAGLASINRLLHDQVGRNLAELIYDGIGDDRPDLKNGKPLTYNAATRAQHRNHVHAAVYDQGGPLYPGYTLAYNGTGQTEWVNKAPSAMPGYGMGGWGGGGAGGRVNVAAPNVTVKVLIDGQEFRGMARIEVDNALGAVHDVIHYAGG